jgi:hypothetical protein
MTHIMGNILYINNNMNNIFFENINNVLIIIEIYCNL